MAWAPDYTTVDDLASYVRIDDDVDDVQLALAISAASRAIDDHTHRQFGKVDVAEERTYVAWYDYGCTRWVLNVDDFVLVTGAGVEITDVGTVTTYVKEPHNAALKGRPWTRIGFTDDSEYEPTNQSREVVVEAVWGWSAVPDTIEQATLLQASRFIARRGAPFGVAGSPDLGNELRLLAKVDPDVAVMLHSYRRPPAVG